MAHKPELCSDMVQEGDHCLDSQQQQGECMSRNSVVSIQSIGCEVGTSCTTRDTGNNSLNIVEGGRVNQNIPQQNEQRFHRSFTEDNVYSVNGTHPNEHSLNTHSLDNDDLTKAQQMKHLPLHKNFILTSHCDINYQEKPDAVSFHTLETKKFKIDNGTKTESQMLEHFEAVSGHINSNVKDAGNTCMLDVGSGLSSCNKISNELYMEELEIHDEKVVQATGGYTQSIIDQEQLQATGGYTQPIIDQEQLQATGGYTQSIIDQEQLQATGGYTLPIIDQEQLQATGGYTQSIIDQEQLQATGGYTQSIIDQEQLQTTGGYTQPIIDQEQLQATGGYTQSIIDQEQLQATGGYTQPIIDQEQLQATGGYTQPIIDQEQLQATGGYTQSIIDQEQLQATGGYTQPIIDQEQLQATGGYTLPIIDQEQLQATGGYTQSIIDQEQLQATGGYTQSIIDQEQLQATGGYTLPIIDQEQLQATGGYTQPIIDQEQLQATGGYTQSIIDQEQLQATGGYTQPIIDQEQLQATGGYTQPIIDQEQLQATGGYTQPIIDQEQLQATGGYTQPIIDQEQLQATGGYTQPIIDQEQLQATGGYTQPIIDQEQLQATGGYTQPIIDQEQLQATGGYTQPIIDQEQLQATGGYTQSIIDQEQLNALNEEYIATCNSDIETFYDKLLSCLAVPERRYCEERIFELSDVLDDNESVYDNAGIDGDISRNNDVLNITRDLTSTYLGDPGLNVETQSHRERLMKQRDEQSEVMGSKPKVVYFRCDCGDLLVTQSTELSYDDGGKTQASLTQNCGCSDLLDDGNSIRNDSAYTANGCAWTKCKLKYQDCNIRARSFFDHLPREIVYKIMSFLTPQELCLYVAPVCSTWLEISRDPILWTRLDVAENMDFSILFRSAIRNASLLKHLSLSGQHEISLGDIMFFAVNCPNLTSLDLGFCDALPPTAFSLILHRFLHLDSLVIEGTNISDHTLDVFSSLPHCQLHKLDLSYCTSVTNDGLVTLATSLRRITKLNIDGLQWIYDSGIRTLVKHHRGHLVSLQVDGEQLTDASIEAISTCQRLRKLSVWFCTQLTDVSLSYCKDLTELRDLTLRKGEMFTVAGLIDVFAAKQLSNLVHINLSECKNISDDVVREICHNARGLQKLSLAWCWELTERAAQAIISNCRYMKCLNLMGVWMNGGTCFANIPEAMPYLSHLSLENCRNVDDDLILEMVRRKPSLKVVDYYGMVFD